MRKKKKGKDYHPAIKEAAKEAHKRMAEHNDALRKSGYKEKVFHKGEIKEVEIGDDLPLEFVEWCVESASIIATIKKEFERVTDEQKKKHIK